MKKKNLKWTNLTSTLLAGTSVAGILLTANRMAKKYGQKINPNRLINIKWYNIIDYGINRFLETDEDEIVSDFEKLR